MDKIIKKYKDQIKEPAGLASIVSGLRLIVCQGYDHVARQPGRDGKSSRRSGRVNANFSYLSFFAVHNKVFFFFSAILVLHIRAGCYSLLTNYHSLKTSRLLGQSKTSLNMLLEEPVVLPVSNRTSSHRFPW